VASPQELEESTGEARSPEKPYRTLLRERLPSFAAGE